MNEVRKLLVESNLQIDSVACEAAASWVVECYPIDSCIRALTDAM